MLGRARIETPGPPGKQELTMATERTLSIIKPDATGAT
jgi:hypothetical protein